VAVAFDGFLKIPFKVIPAQAGIQKRPKTLDPGMLSIEKAIGGYSAIGRCEILIRGAR
jgi:hypothetical protein